MWELLLAAISESTNCRRNTQSHNVTCKQLWYSFCAYFVCFFSLSFVYSSLQLNLVTATMKQENITKWLNGKNAGWNNIFLIDIGLEDNTTICIKYPNVTQCNGIETCTNYVLSIRSVSIIHAFALQNRQLSATAVSQIITDYIQLISSVLKFTFILSPNCDHKSFFHFSSHFSIVAKQETHEIGYSRNALHKMNICFAKHQKFIRSHFCKTRNF